MTVETALRQGTALLEEAAIPAARLTAEVLLAHALGRERSWLYGHPEHELGRIAWIHYGRYLHERLEGKPTQYITKRQEFYGREFRVTADVLIPRPETEHVIEAVLREPPAGRMVDIGAGSGAIAVTLALETRATVIATDISTAALTVAAENARRIGARVQWIVCDLLWAVRDASMDLVVSNPPYVPSEDMASLQREVRDWEPHVALAGGAGGLDIYRRIVSDAPRVLVRGGRLVMELGFKTSDAVRAMLSEPWEDIRIEPDLAGIPRVLTARLKR